jgi:hypothetical protein
MKGVKCLDKEKYKSRWIKLMNLIDCILYVHIHVLACIFISPKIQYAYLCGVC